MVFFAGTLSNVRYTRRKYTVLAKRTNDARAFTSGLFAYDKVQPQCTRFQEPPPSGEGFGLGFRVRVRVSPHVVRLTTLSCLFAPAKRRTCFQNPIKPKPQNPRNAKRAIKSVQG